MELKFLEVFESWQGEGASQGIRAMFYRMAGCNLRCPWCDTKYSWGGNEEVDYRDPEFGIKLVVITGGEPLWDNNRVKTEQLIHRINEWAKSRNDMITIEIETNGTRPKLDIDLKKLNNISIIRYVVSPKQEGDFYPTWCYNPSSKENIIFKLVVGSKQDIEWVGYFIEMTDNAKIARDKIWIMPLGQSLKELVKNSSFAKEVAKEYGLNLSFRSQILLGVK